MLVFLVTEGSLTDAFVVVVVVSFFFDFDCDVVGRLCVSSSSFNVCFLIVDELFEEFDVEVELRGEVKVEVEVAEGLVEVNEGREF